MVKYFTYSAALLFLLLTACGRSPRGDMADYTGEMRERNFSAGLASAAQAEAWEGAGFNAEMAARPSPQAVPEIAPQDAVRKLVYRAAIHIRVENPEAVEQSLGDAIAKYGAYTSSTNITESQRQYTIRVPSISYAALLNDIGGMGKVLFKSENTEDVTVQYYDLEGRLATKKELLKTFQGYLGRAKNIEEILSVEQRIAELEDDIDGTGRQLRSLANLVDYATITLELRSPSVSFYHEPTLGDRLREFFGSFKDAASTILIIILGIVIYGVPCILAVTLLFWLLFGRVGLIKRLWRLAAGRKRKPAE
jgi:hypothetical protein